MATMKTIGDVSDVATDTLRDIHSLICSGMDKLNEDVLLGDYSEEDIESARMRWEVGAAVLNDINQVIEAREQASHPE